MTALAELNARMRQMQVNTLRTRKLQQVQALVRNIARLEGKLRINPQCAPMHGRVAFIVGAGPSLDRNIEILRDVWAGNPILTVPTATPALVKAGIVPTMVFASDCLPLSHFLDGLDDRTEIVADWQSHADVFDRAQWFCASYYLETCRLADALDMEPNRTGGSALTIAYDFADSWGADTIVFVGADMSYDTDAGKAYADGSGWGGLTAAQGETPTQVVLGGREDRRQLHGANAVAYPPDARDAILVKRWGGAPGSVPTTMELFSQLDWLSGRAIARQRRGRRVLNATEGGANIPGVEDMPLEDALRLFVPQGPMELERRAMLAIDADALLDMIAADADMALGLCGSMILGEPYEWQRPMVDGVPAISFALATPRWLELDARRATTSPPDHIAQHYDILRTASETISAAVSAARATLDA